MPFNIIDPSVLFSVQKCVRSLILGRILWTQRISRVEEGEEAENGPLASTPLREETSISSSITTDNRVTDADNRQWFRSERGHLLLWSITREPACYPNWTDVEPETWIHRLPKEKLLDWANSICLVFDFPFLKTSKLSQGFWLNIWSFLDECAIFLLLLPCCAVLFLFFIFCWLYMISLNDTPEFYKGYSFFWNVPRVPHSCGSYLNSSCKNANTVLQSFTHSHVVLCNKSWDVRHVLFI